MTTSAEVPKSTTDPGHAPARDWGVWLKVSKRWETSRGPLTEADARDLALRFGGGISPSPYEARRLPEGMAAVLQDLDDMREAHHKQCETNAPLERENKALRAICIDTVNAIGNRSAASPDVSADFLKCLPDEVRGYCGSIREKLATTERALEDWKGIARRKEHQLAERQGMVEYWTRQFHQALRERDVRQRKLQAAEAALQLFAEAIGEIATLHAETLEAWEKRGHCACARVRQIVAAVVDGSANPTTIKGASVVGTDGRLDPAAVARFLHEAARRSRPLKIGHLGADDEPLADEEVEEIRLSDECVSPTTTIRRLLATIRRDREALSTAHREQQDVRKALDAQDSEDTWTAAARARGEAAKLRGKCAHQRRELRGFNKSERRRLEDRSARVDDLERQLGDAQERLRDLRVALDAQPTEDLVDAAQRMRASRERYESGQAEAACREALGAKDGESTLAASKRVAEERDRWRAEQESAADLLRRVWRHVGDNGSDLPARNEDYVTRAAGLARQLVRLAEQEGRLVEGLRWYARRVRRYAQGSVDAGHELRSDNGHVAELAILPPAEPARGVWRSYLGTKRTPRVGDRVRLDGAMCPTGRMHEYRPHLGPSGAAQVAWREGADDRCLYPLERLEWLDDGTEQGTPIPPDPALVLVRRVSTRTLAPTSVIDAFGRSIQERLHDGRIERGQGIWRREGALSLLDLLRVASRQFEREIHGHPADVLHWARSVGAWAMILADLFGGLTTAERP